MNHLNPVINDFMKKTVRNLTICLKSSFDLPVKENSEDSIFNEYPQYKKVLNGLSLKVLNNIQHLIDNQDGKGNLLDSAEKKGIEDKFNILVEVNDRLLDKCNDLINAIENPNSTKPSQMIVVEYTKPLEHLPQDGSKMTPKQTIKLLSSVQVERPQLKFSKPIDNSKVPFRPILTTKPNAIEPLEKSLVNIVNSDEEQYPHPYKEELDQFVTPAEQFNAPENPEFPKPLDQTPYEYIDTVEKLRELIVKLKSEKEIAVDLEHHGVRTYLGLTCLIQISTRSADYVIDSLALYDHLSILNDIFTDPNIVKVFHGSNSDLMWLQRDFGVYVVNMFDTGHACQSLKFPRKSLSFLLEKYCQIQANKEYQRLTDWRIRPLIAELIEYARTDTHYLLYIYDKLRKDLTDHECLNDVFESSRKLCYSLYYKPKCDLEDCMELYRKSSENFNPRQLYALKRLWELRDNIAREEDESSPFVLPNRILLSIAQALPRETSGVLACCSQEWKLPLLRKYVYDFQKICLESYNESMRGEEQKAPVKKNILDFLLSKHDRTVTEDDQIAVQCDVEDVENSMKVQEPLIRSYASKNDRVDTSIVKVYLMHHPMETVSIEQPQVNEPTPEVVVDEDSDESDVEIVEIEPENKSNQSADTKSEINPRKRDLDSSNCEPHVVREKKIRTVVPFDYEASLKNLQQSGSVFKSSAKQFQPFNTKKFKKNQKNKNR